MGELRVGKEVDGFVRVVVASKAEVKQFVKNGRAGVVLNCQVLGDDGVKARLCFFNQACALVLERIVEQGTYDIAGGFVSESYFGEQAMDIKYTGKVLCREVVGSDLVAELDVQELKAMVQKPLDSRLDLGGILLGASEVRNAEENKERRMVLIGDECGNAVRIVLWGQHARRPDSEFQGCPVVAFRGVAVKEYIDKRYGSVGYDGAVYVGKEAVARVAPAVTGLADWFQSSAAPSITGFTPLGDVSFAIRWPCSDSTTGTVSGFHAEGGRASRGFREEGGGLVGTFKVRFVRVPHRVEAGDVTYSACKAEVKPGRYCMKKECSEHSAKREPHFHFRAQVADGPGADDAMWVDVWGSCGEALLNLPASEASGEAVEQAFESARRKAFQVKVRLNWKQHENGRIEVWDVEEVPLDGKLAALDVEKLAVASPLKSNPDGDAARVAKRKEQAAKEEAARVVKERRLNDQAKRRSMGSLKSRLEECCSRLVLAGSAKEAQRGYAAIDAGNESRMRSVLEELERKLGGDWGGVGCTGGSGRSWQ